MKVVRIIEADPKYREELTTWLLGQGATPYALEVPDDFDETAIEGLALLSHLPAQGGASQAAARPFAEEFAEVAAWLNNYKGNFEFYLSLRAQLQTRGRLSPKQIDCVKRAIERDKAQGVPVAPGVVPTFTLKPGSVIVVTKFIANRVAEEAGSKRAHPALDVLEVMAETEKAYRVKVRLSAKRTSFCGCCGLSLENPQSIAAGVGPICADKYGIPYGEGSLEALEKVLAVTQEVTTWLPKSKIKERIEPNA